MGRSKKIRKDIEELDDETTETSETSSESLVPNPGDRIKVVDRESPAWNKTETVRGVHEGKKAKFSV